MLEGSWIGPQLFAILFLHIFYLHKFVSHMYVTWKMPSIRSLSLAIKPYLRVYLVVSRRKKK